MLRELKKYKLRASRRPYSGPLFSGVVLIVESGRKSYAHVQFSEAFLEAVGRSLPVGLTVGRPGYLKALQLPSGRWRLFAMYLREEVGVLLWEADKKPEWLVPVQPKPEKAQKRKQKVP